ncbi:MAG: hypothetical protein NWQ38_16830 [Cellulophaga sp.]|nr:hypothetical protein [Cellulophaga sp.]
MIEVLKGIDLVLDYKSNQLFGKALKHLNLDELKELDSNFYAKLLIVDYSPIINTQPPEIENDSIVRF